MHDSVRYPGQNIQSNMLMGGQDVAQIGAVDDIFESREDADPDGRSVVGRYVSGIAVSMFDHLCRSRVRVCATTPVSQIMLTGASEAQRSGDGTKTNLLAT